MNAQHDLVCRHCPSLFDDCIKLTRTYINETLKRVGGDEELARVLQQVIAHDLQAQSKRLCVLLPLLTCELMGGNPANAVPLSAAWNILRLAASIFDDLQDAATISLPGLATNPAVAMNAATGLVLLAHLILARESHGATHPSIVHQLCNELQQTSFRICVGQHIDLTSAGSDSFTLDDYWHMVGAKSGACLAWACKAGSALGGGTPEQVANCESYGYNLAILAQIGNDWRGLQQKGGASDIALGKKTLPVLYALAVATPRKRHTLNTLLMKARECRQAETRARTEIIALGGLHYTLVVAEIWRQRAQRALQSMAKGSLRDYFLSLIDTTFAPPRRILCTS